ncbi:hypothetical protein FALCPG4_015352 [Fusarium falciforme]
MDLHALLNKSYPDVGQLEDLLESGTSPSAENADGQTPLYKAIYMSEDINAIELLLKYGADPDDGGRRGEPLLFRALDDAKNMVAKVSCLLDHGADPDIHVGNRNFLGAVCELPSSLAPAKFKLLTLLLKHHGAQAYVEDPGPDFIQPLEAAVMGSNDVGWPKQCLDLIIGAIPQQHRQLQLDTALKMATMPHPKRHKRNPTRYLPFQLEGPGLVNEPFTALYLLEQGADICLHVSDDYGILHWICSRTSIGHEHTKTFEALLSRDQCDIAMINAKDSRGRTPLHWSVAKLNRDFVLALLKHGADVNIADHRCQSPLHLLCATETAIYPMSEPERVEEEADSESYDTRDRSTARIRESNKYRAARKNLLEEEIIQALLASDANSILRDEAGCTPFMIACQTGNALAAANIIYHYASEIVSCGLEPALKPILSPRDGSDRTVLHLAASGGHHDVVKLILNPRQVFVRQPNPWRKYAVDDSRARHTGEENYKCLLQIYECRRRLRKPGGLAYHTSFLEPRTADSVVFTIGSAARRFYDQLTLPNVSFSTWTVHAEPELRDWYRGVDNQGWTVLHHAAAAGKATLVQYLLDAGVVALDARTRDMKTAADLTLDKSHDDVWRILIDSEEQSGDATFLRGALHALRSIAF